MDFMNEKEAIGALELLYLAKDQKALIEISRNPQLNSQIRGYAAGLLMRPWLPWGILRKVVMVLLLLMGFCGFIFTGKIAFSILIIVALSFSPRLGGEFLRLFSRK